MLDTTRKFQATLKSAAVHPDILVTLIIKNDFHTIRKPQVIHYQRQNLTKMINMDGLVKISTITVLSAMKEPAHSSVFWQHDSGSVDG